MARDRHGRQQSDGIDAEHVSEVLPSRHTHNRGALLLLLLLHFVQKGLQHGVVGEDCAGGAPHRAPTNGLNQVLTVLEGLQLCLDCIRRPAEFLGVVQETVVQLHLQCGAPGGIRGQVYLVQKKDLDPERGEILPVAIHQTDNQSIGDSFHVCLHVATGRKEHALRFYYYGSLMPVWEETCPNPNPSPVAPNNNTFGGLERVRVKVIVPDILGFIRLAPRAHPECKASWEFIV